MLGAPTAVQSLAAAIMVCNPRVSPYDDLSLPLQRQDPLQSVWWRSEAVALSGERLRTRWCGGWWAPVKLKTGDCVLCVSGSGGCSFNVMSTGLVFVPANDATMFFVSL